MAIEVYYLCGHRFRVSTKPDRYEGAVRSDKLCPDCKPRPLDQAESEANGWHAVRLPM